jgi:hypothetical protein
VRPSHGLTSSLRPCVRLSVRYRPRDNTGHDIIEVLPKYHMRSSILGQSLHIADHNRHDSAICKVINVASHGGPLLDTLNVIEHDPRFL